MKFKSLPGVIVIAVFALTLTAAAFGQNAPKIAIKQTEHNFGEVNRGAALQHTFVLKNEGKADLEIRNVAPS